MAANNQALNNTNKEEPVNPIELFFNPENAKRLYTTIQQGLQERYNVRIDTRYHEQLIEIMKMVLEPLPKRIPKNVDTTRVVRALNQQTLKEALPMFADIAKGNTPPPAPGEKDTSLSGQFRARMNDISGRGNPMLGDARSQSTPIAPNDPTEDEQSFQDMMHKRKMMHTQAQEAPQFADPEVNYPDDVNDLYEAAEHERQFRDVLQPPDPTADLPFEPMQGFAVRNNPTDYGAAEPSSTQLFNPDVFDQQPPISTERLNQEMIKPSRPLHTTDHGDLSDVDFAVKSGQQMGFGEIAPQPAQMRLLIPKTSRNLVHDSSNIPHIFVVDSSTDRNPAVNPNPSEYRVQLRDQFLDVVSVELVRATVPLSLFNVNQNNNQILFQEVDGVTQVAIIPVGNYPDIDTLGMAVATSMTAASTGGVTYTHTLNVLTNKVTLTSDGFGGAIFNLIFFGQPSLEGEGTPEFKKEKPQYPTNSIGPVLGYDSLDYSGDTAYEAPFVPNLAGEAVLYLHVQELELLESNNPGVHDAFAAIDLVGVDFARFEPKDANHFIKYFSPPKGKLGFLTISFRDTEGRLVDFNGRNHCLTFEIITKDKTKGPYDAAE